MPTINRTFASFSVDNLEAARQFYSEKLGLKVSETEMSTLDMEAPGGYHVMVYEKPNHTPATFTVLNFLVSELEKEVQELKDKGVAFESYDLPDLKTDENDIMRGNGPTIAWFTDPAGNILSLIQE